MHPQRHGNVRRFTERCVLCSVMTLAKVVDAVANSVDDKGISAYEWACTGHSQVSDDDVH